MQTVSPLRTSIFRRVLAALGGVITLMVCVLIAASCIDVWLAPDSEGLLVSLSCWLAAGFVSTFVGAGCAVAIAWDLEAELFFRLLTAVLLVLAIAGAIDNGGALEAWLRSVIMVVGGVTAARQALL
jgi:hypothetical protein